MSPGGIRTHDLSWRAAADLRLRPRGHCDRQPTLDIADIFIYVVRIRFNRLNFVTEITRNLFSTGTFILNP